MAPKFWRQLSNYSISRRSHLFAEITQKLHRILKFSVWILARKFKICRSLIFWGLNFGDFWKWNTNSFGFFWILMFSGKHGNWQIWIMRTREFSNFWIFWTFVRTTTDEWPQRTNVYGRVLRNVRARYSCATTSARCANQLFLIPPPVAQCISLCCTLGNGKCRGILFNN